MRYSNTNNGGDAFIISYSMENSGIYSRRTISRSLPREFKVREDRMERVMNVLYGGVIITHAGMKEVPDPRNGERR